MVHKMNTAVPVLMSVTRGEGRQSMKYPIVIKCRRDSRCLGDNV